MSEEICCITNKGKAAKDGSENDDSDFPQALFSVYETLGQLFFHNYLFTFLKKNTSVLLTVMNLLTIINIYTS